MCAGGTGQCFDLAVSLRHQRLDSAIVQRLTGHKFDMSHAFAGTLQQAGRVFHLRTQKEAEIGVGFEAPGVGKRIFTHTSCGVVVMHQIHYVIPQRTYFVKPMACQGTLRSGLVVSQPLIDSG